MTRHESDCYAWMGHDPERARGRLRRPYARLLAELYLPNEVDVVARAA